MARIITYEYAYVAGRNAIQNMNVANYNQAPAIPVELVSGNVIATKSNSISLTYQGQNNISTGPYAKSSSYASGTVNVAYSGDNRSSGVDPRVQVPPCGGTPSNTATTQSASIKYTMTTKNSSSIPVSDQVIVSSDTVADQYASYMASQGLPEPSASDSFKLVSAKRLVYMVQCIQNFYFSKIIKYSNAVGSKSILLYSEGATVTPINNWSGENGEALWDDLSSSDMQIMINNLNNLIYVKNSQRSLAFNSATTSSSSSSSCSSSSCSSSCSSSSCSSSCSSSSCSSSSSSSSSSSCSSMFIAYFNIGE